MSIQSVGDKTYGYASGELNLLTSVNGNTVSYDKWGNITYRGDKGHTYTFNEIDQLTQVNSGSTVLGQYFYNGEGKRYKKVENSKTTYYVYSGENLLYEVRPDLTICYIYLEGKPVARVEEDVQGIRRVYYYHTDLQGSTRVITDSTGNIVKNYDYDIFGIPKTSISGESVAYTTKGQDATGLYYFNARYYDPTLGRFISEDPAKDGANWYVFCSNNPLKYVDPSGNYVVAIDGTFQMGVLWLAGEVGVTMAFDSRGYRGFFFHAGRQFQFLASASVSAGIVYAPTMNDVRNLEGKTIWGGISAGGFISGGFNVGRTSDGKYLFEVAVGAGVTAGPGEVHKYVDYTFRHLKYETIPAEWEKVAPNLYVRHMDGVTYVRDYNFHRSYVITENKMKIYQLGGENNGQLLNVYVGEELEAEWRSAKW